LRNETAIINQIRGLAREYGVNFAKSREVLLEQLPDALAEHTTIYRRSLAKSSLSSFRIFTASAIDTRRS
jgi:hypothetical protein